RGELAFFGPDDVAVDRGGAWRRVAKPALNEMLGYVGLEGVDAKAMAQTFRCRVHAGDMRLGHHLFHAVPRRRAAPIPKPSLGFFRIMLALAKLKNVIEFVEHIAWQRHLAHDARLTTFECLDDRDAAFDVDCSWRERKYFGNSGAAKPEYQ